jgi:GNAT superfamily N-acetyltransferase
MAQKIQKLKQHRDALPLIRATMPGDVRVEAAEDLSVNAGCTLYGYYTDNALIGVCGWWFDGRVYWLSWTAVQPNYQRRGIGQALLDVVIRDVYDYANDVYVETYEDPAFYSAVRFYWKNGFKLCGYRENALESGATAFFMKKTL